MASLFHSIYESKDNTYSTKNFNSEWSTLEEIEIEPQSYRQTVLSDSLATITNLCYEGVTSLDTMPSLLTNLRNTIMESMIYCIRIDRESYEEYTRALARKNNLFMERIVLQIINACNSTMYSVSCSNLIKAAHDVMLLTYSFTNPSRIPEALHESFSDDDFSPPFQIHLLLEATKKLQASLSSTPYFKESRNPHLTSATYSMMNNTPRNLLMKEAAEIQNLLTKMNLVVINNCMPTVATFTYFQEILMKDEFTLLDLEFFEEFITHFSKINMFASKLERTRLFDKQKQLLQAPYFQMLQLNPFRKSNWCTSLQAVNYLQIFVDLYNEIYNEGLILERWYDNDTGQESTIIKKVVDDEVSQACECEKDHPPPSIPEFVNFFDSVGQQGTERLGNTGRVEEGDDSRSYLSVKENAACFESAKLSKTGTFESISRCSKIFQLNEEVAYEVRDIRSRVETKCGVNKVNFKHQKCLKCKYWPWHKHIF